MGAAAYNAGPGRLRRWRDGPLIEAAVWAENIPFNETRDYVKKVLSNATVYAALLAGRTQVAAAPPAPPALPASASAAAASGATEPTASAASASLPAIAASAARPAPVVVVHAQLPSLKARLGALIGPRASALPPPDKELP